MKKIICPISSLVAVALSTQAATLVVNNQSPHAADTNAGTVEAPFKTINAAAQVAQAGDTVRVHAGTYRERVMPARGGTADKPVVYQAAVGEEVVVKGSETWSGIWTADAENPRVFSSKIDVSVFDGMANPYTRSISVSSSDKGIVARPVAEADLDKPWLRTLGQIFVQGEPLTQMQTLEAMRHMEGSWIVSADGTTLWVHLPGMKPADVVLPSVEWTVRERIFAPHKRGLAHIHVKGFTFLHCANQGPFPQGGAVSTRTGNSWIIEDCSIRFAKTIGLDIGSETWSPKTLKDADEADQRLIIQANHIVRNCEISDNGLCGIAGWNSPNIKIYNNVLERNNRLHFSNADCGWEEWAAIKLHCSNGVIAGNVIRFNEAYGVWIDNGYNNSRITGNAIIGSVGGGVMLELGAGSCLVDNNIITHTRSYGGFYDGNGVYAHDASGVTVVHNLLSANAGAGVLMRTITDRKYANKLVETSNTRILNNVFDNNLKGAICMPYDNPRSHSNFSDYNVFTRTPAFRLNKYQDQFSWDAIADQLEKAGMDDAAESTDAQQEGVFRAFDLEAWRHVTGWDKNSVFTEKVSFSVLPYRMLLRMNITEEFDALRFPAVDEMTTDYRGVEMRSSQFDSDFQDQTARPGAIQNIMSGKSEVGLTPVRYIEPPALRQSFEKRKELDGQKRFDDADVELKQATQGKDAVVYSFIEELESPSSGLSPWWMAQQDSVNPKSTQMCKNDTGKLQSTLYAQSAKGPSASPASCLLFEVPSAGLCNIKLDAELIKRASASAGFTRVSLDIVDFKRQIFKPLWKQDLNTPEGHRGKTLSQKTTYETSVTSPEGSTLVLRFQVVAPGPAAAGHATLKINDYSIEFKAADALQPKTSSRQNTSLPTSFSFSEALAQDPAQESPWYCAYQEDVNPLPSDPLIKDKRIRVANLHSQTPKGVCSSPAHCIVFEAPEAGDYSVDLKGKLIKRSAESAGYTRASLVWLNAGGACEANLDARFKYTQRVQREKALNTSCLFWKSFVHNRI